MEFMESVLKTGELIPMACNKIKRIGEGEGPTVLTLDCFLLNINKKIYSNLGGSKSFGNSPGHATAFVQ